MKRIAFQSLYEVIGTLNLLKRLFKILQLRSQDDIELHVEPV